MYNERNVAQRIIEAVCALDWPKHLLQIQVLDDSTDNTIHLLHQIVRQQQSLGINIKLLHRQDRSGYKAGALQQALPQADGEYIAIFDADFIPQPNFLKEMMPFFSHPNIGMVQACWGHHNRNQNLLTMLSATLLDGHFVIEHTARNRSGRFFNFNGTAGVWKKQCLIDSGGWSSDTITEDLDISYRAQLKGWKFIYAKDCVVPAEVPSQMDGFTSQQFRWAKGTTQVAKKLLMTLWKSEFNLAIKLEASLHFLSNIAHPLTLLLAIVMPFAAIIRQQQNMFLAGSLDLIAFVATTFSIFAYYILANKEAHQPLKLWKFPLVLALGIGININQSTGFFQGLYGSDKTFVRTPKKGDHLYKNYSLPKRWIAVLEIMMGTYCMVGIIWLGSVNCFFPMPFLALFCFGYFYVGMMSIIPEKTTSVGWLVEKKNDPVAFSDHG